MFWRWCMGVLLMVYGCFLCGVRVFYPLCGQVFVDDGQNAIFKATSEIMKSQSII